MTNRPMSDIVKDQNPLILPARTRVKEACECMRDRRAGAVLVTDDQGRLVGIFTGRDAVGRVLAAARNAAKTTLGEVMTPDPNCLPPGNTAIDALRLMRDGGFRHVPVVTRDGKIVGVVSRGDLRGQEQARLDEETRLFERIW
jgi:CBS domain-containing protein